ncbi:glycosyltransferase family 4 protein [Pedobacter sp. KBS0701]|uniref:glycosyltransferase family 4 protein n=1 Tax=Pedobacter sp. KBS0701 TaxID=2578106 RepID=UPI00110E9C24|nr:glycosyltransferase family 1 protein [Pedobacter sp. KBS0701]QDW26941.1 glycosyltransferase family 4 protein [Pedobacter sp. KBS0701]
MMTGDIYVNGRFLSHKMDGIGRFSLEICKQLKELGLNFIIVIPKWLDYANNEGFRIIKYGNLKSHFWEQLDLYYFLKLNKNPLLISFSGLGPLFYKNQITTIHDLSFYANKEWFSKTYTFVYGIATPIVARSSKKIFTVSNFSKSEIVKYLGIKEAKIEVIYNAVANHLYKAAPADEVTPKVNDILKEKYVLAVSSLDPRKNLQGLIDSFLALELSDCKLVLVGKASNHFNIRLDATDKNILFTGFVSDTDLLALYTHCEFFIYPSFYEGFGIPPLEAMKSGCAVLASRIPSLEEVCADAALYINPYDINDMKEKMLAVMEDIELRNELKAKGIIRSRFFTWEASGKKVYELIKNFSF